MESKAIISYCYDVFINIHTNDEIKMKIETEKHKKNTYSHL